MSDQPHRAEALLLTCIDHRLPELITRYMAERGLTGRYDYLAMAGAALGVTADRFPAWDVAFRQHIELALQLHGIRRLMVMDHRDCAAYRQIHGEEALASAEKERAIHASTLGLLRERIKVRFPQLEVELLLIALDGSVEQIP
jgi:carbonic anhydrase